MNKRSDKFPNSISELEEALGLTNPFPNGSDAWFEREKDISVELSIGDKSPSEIKKFLEFVKGYDPESYPRYLRVANKMVKRKK